MMLRSTAFRCALCSPHIVLTACTCTETVHVSMHVFHPIADVDPARVSADKAMMDSPRADGCPSSSLQDSMSLELHAKSSVRDR